MKKDYLKNAVLKYIKNNSGKVDAVDIQQHFKLCANFTLMGLEEDGLIERRHTFGAQYKYFYTGD